MIDPEEGHYEGIAHIDVPPLPDGYDTHLISYEYEGGTWLLEIPARSKEDAEARLSVAATWGNYMGAGVMKIPASSGWWVPAWCWFRNLFGK